MTFASSALRPRLVAIALVAAMAASPLAAAAQTAESAAGTAPSQALSRPPNTAPINQPGAMREAYAHRAAKLRPQHHAAPAASSQSGSSGKAPH